MNLKKSNSRVINGFPPSYQQNVDKVKSKKALFCLTFSHFFNIMLNDV